MEMRPWGMSVAYAPYIPQHPQHPLMQVAAGKLCHSETRWHLELFGELE